jgi:hypothetical protein
MTALKPATWRLLWYLVSVLCASVGAFSLAVMAFKPSWSSHALLDLLALPLGPLVCLQLWCEIREERSLLVANTRQPTTENAAAGRASKPPKFAHFWLMLLLNDAETEGLIGDLNERFCRECGLDPKRAYRMYWRRAIASFWPLLRRAGARAIRWNALAESVRRRF